MLFPDWLAPRRIPRPRSAYFAAWYAKNAERVRAKRRARYQQNHDAELERCRRWRAQNPERAAEISQRASRKYRARKRAQKLQAWA